MQEVYHIVYYLPPSLGNHLLVFTTTDYFGVLLFDCVCVCCYNQPNIDHMKLVRLKTQEINWPHRSIHHIYFDLLPQFTLIP